MREHGQGGPPVPGRPAADLVLVQTGEPFAGLEALLYPPPLTGDRDQRGQRHPARTVRPVVGDLTGVVVAAQQQPVPPRLGGFDPDPRPGIHPRGRGTPHRRTTAASGPDRSGRRAGRLEPVRCGWRPAGCWPPPARTPGRGPATWTAAPGRRRTPRHRPPMPAGTPASNAAVICRAANAGLVANSVPAGTPAAAHRAGSSVQDCGRYRSRSINACPRRRGVRQVHRDLGVLGASRGPGVLALHPHRMGALLQVTGLVDHQNGARITEVIDHVGAQIVTHPVGVPHRSGQQMLQRIRRPGAAVLGDRPTVLPVQITRQQPEHQLRGVPPRLVPGEPATDPVQHLTERQPPTIRVYAMRRGHRGVFVVPHKHRMIARWPPSPAPTRPRSQTRRVGDWRGAVDYRSVSSPRPSNRACDSPAHGLPTFFTGRIQPLQSRKGLGGMTVPSRRTKPRCDGESRICVMPQPQARRRLPRLDNQIANRCRA